MNELQQILSRPEARLFILVEFVLCGGLVGLLLLKLGLRWYGRQLKKRPIEEVATEMFSVIASPSESGSGTTLFIPLDFGIAAKLEVTVIEEPVAPTPNERATVRPPTVTEVDLIGQQLLRRNWRFTPED